MSHYNWQGSIFIPMSMFACNRLEKGVRFRMIARRPNWNSLTEKVTTRREGPQPTLCVCVCVGGGGCRCVCVCVCVFFCLFCFLIFVFVLFCFVLFVCFVLFLFVLFCFVLFFYSSFIFNFYFSGGGGKQKIFWGCKEIIEFMFIKRDVRSFTIHLGY